MKREFLIEEIMLDGVSGEVRGTFELDMQSGLIDRVACDTFAFRVDETDAPVLLDPSQRVFAVQTVERLLDRQTELFSRGGPLVASAQAMPATRVVARPNTDRSAEAASTRILAELLESAGRHDDDQNERRAQ